MQKVKDRFRTKVIELYSTTCYSLGAGYIKQLVNNRNNNNNDKEIFSSVSSQIKDKDIINSLSEKYSDQFWSLIDSYNNMQRSENRLGYQIIAGEKEKLASEFASKICWTSFNQGIKNKGIEYKDEIAKLGQGDEIITGIVRDIRNKDLSVKRQLILTTRLTQEDFEKLSAVRRRSKEERSLPIKKGPPAKRGRPVTIKEIPGLERNLKGLEDFARIVFVLVTQKDEKVCPECMALELETWESGDPDLPDPPIHENCRCSLRLAESEFLE